MMNLYSKVCLSASNYKHSQQLSRTYEKFRDFTMIPDWVYRDNLVLAEKVLHIPGCVVECGVWKGGMIAGIASMLGNDREYFLFDSFEGLPPAQEIDGKSAIAWQEDRYSADYHDNCTAQIEIADKAMRLSKATSYHLVKGWFDHTLPTFRAPQPIALLRLDADWYESTTLCLEHLFDQVAVGGLIVLDDYYTWDGCSRAVHDFLSRHSLVERIRNHGNICYLVKAPSV
jgi:O-methyltransferase